MKTHLSQDALFLVILGRASREEEDHCRECMRCGAAIKSIQNPIATFRTAMREWSEDQTVPPVESLRSKTFRTSLRLAAAAVISAAVLIGFMVYESRRSHSVATAPVDRIPAWKDATSNSVRLSEEQLLLRVNAQLSRTVAAPLEPLQALLPTTQPKDQKPTGRNP